MPELPEVETVRRTLKKKVIGKTIHDIELLYDRIIKTDLEEFKQLVKRQTIRDIDRIGKYLLFKLDDYYLISHLRMEGKYFLREMGLERDKHDHIIFIFDDGTELRYNDVRKFGTMHLKVFDETFKGEPLEKLGYEPFDERFDLDYMRDKFKCKKPIKSALLDQTIVTGLGNIYVDEVLFLSNLHPTTLAHTLSDEHLLTIKESSIKVLNKAIDLGGSTIRSYYSDDEISGRFQNELLVHQRKDEPCFTCETKIIKTKVGGRGTYYCPICQSM